MDDNLAIRTQKQPQIPQSLSPSFQTLSPVLQERFAQMSPEEFDAFLTPEGRRILAGNQPIRSQGYYQAIQDYQMQPMLYQQRRRHLMMERAENQISDTSSEQIKEINRMPVRLPPLITKVSDKR